MEQVLERFSAYLEKSRAFEHAAQLMYYDMETTMPPAASPLLGDTLGVLSEVSYERSTSPELMEMIQTILDAGEDRVGENWHLVAKRLSEQHERTACIPKEEFVEYQVQLVAAQNAWLTAKRNNDFWTFLPHLEKLVETNARFARYYKPNEPVYDTLLDDYEKGMTTEKLDEFFKSIREKLVPLLRKILLAPAPDTSFLKKSYPVEKQRELSDYLMQVMGMDRTRSTIGETEHPFTINFTKNDVRITTHYFEDAVASSMYSVVHEAGHATYELNVADEITRLPIGGGVSMGVHESQSRFFENIIGRSEPFIRYIFPKLKELFPEQLDGVTPHDFYRAVNKAEPSLIRTEADELTYGFHIMVRYELEKRLFDGSLKPQDLPKAWNESMMDYLGIEVPCDAEGVLQDMHWSGGSFGYFPSYAIGSAYAAQLLNRMEQDMDVWGEVEKGNLAPIIEWLTERIYRHGSKYDPTPLMEQAFGEPFSPAYYVDYLVKKYTDLYHLTD